jgi:hypothetical protein
MKGMYFLDNLIAIMQANIGGFVSGAIVAVLQLVIVYLWIDRRVERVQLKSEARKWKDARQELDATLLSLAHTLVRPLAYYTLSDARGVYVRENYSACLKHVVAKSATLDAMLAIYSVGLAPSSFTKITQLADRLRSVASNAETALNNLRDIEAEFPKFGQEAAAHVENIRRATSSIEFEVPKDPRARKEKLFAYYVLQVINEISWISEQMSDLALDKHEIEELDQTSRYTRLKELSKGEQTAAQDHVRIAQSIVTLRSLVELIESKGVILATAAEVD